MCEDPLMYVQNRTMGVSAFYLEQNTRFVAVLRLSLSSNSFALLNNEKRHFTGVKCLWFTYVIFQEFNLT